MSYQFNLIFINLLYFNSFIMHCSYVSFDIALNVIHSHSLVLVSYENDNNLVDPLKLNYII